VSAEQPRDEQSVNEQLAAQIVRGCRELPSGSVDSAVVAAAERLSISDLATLDLIEDGLRNARYEMDEFLLRSAL
jgi:hypothetical protein